MWDLPRSGQSGAPVMDLVAGRVLLEVWLPEIGERIFRNRSL